MKAVLLALPLLFGSNDPQVTNYCQSENNSWGTNAVISWGVSAGEGEYTITVDGMVPGTFSHLTMGTVPMNLPFGNGWLCVHPAYTQFVGTPQQSSQGGSRIWNTDLSFVDPGNTVYFQAWYRDPNVGMGFNTSDGLQVARPASN